LDLIIKQNSRIAFFEKLLSFLILLFFSFNGLSQVDYSVLISQDQENLSRGKLDLDENGGAMIFALSTPSNELHVIKYDFNQIINESIGIKFQNNSPSFSLFKWGSNKYKFFGDHAFALMEMSGNVPHLIGLDMSIKSTWSKRIDGNIVEGSLQTSQEDQMLFLSYGGVIGLIRLVFFDFNGNELVNKNLAFSLSNKEIISGGTYKIKQIGSNFIIALSFRVDDSQIAGFGGIIRCNSKGDILDQIFSKNILLKDVDVNGSSIYLSMGFVNVDNETSDGRIIHLDESFEVIWSKRIHADNFIAREVLVDAQSDQIVLAYSTFGSFPVILAKLDLDGNLVHQTGLSNYTPDFDIDNNGNIYITSGLEAQQDGSLEAKLVTRRFMDIENIESCSDFNSCLEISEDTYELIDVFIEITEGEAFESRAVEITQDNLTLTDYCQDLQPPEATFDFQDNICLHDCGVPENLKNVLANFANWELIDPNGNLTIIEELSPSFCFDELGTYTLKQTIWYLGCSESFEKEIIVSELSEIDFDIDDPCLDSEPLVISLEDENKLLSFMWENGTTNNYLEVYESGNYSVAVSDTVCNDTLSFEVQKQKFELNDVISFVQNETICSNELPFELSPATNNNNLFAINDNSEPSSTVLLEEFGSYIVKTQIGNCIFEKEFELSEKDCETNVFVPTAFSPNGDGINDQLSVFLKNLEFVSIEIYSRWGSKVFESKDKNIQWDGMVNGKLIDPDLFLYVLQVKSNDDIQLVTGDFILLR